MARVTLVIEDVTDGIVSCELSSDPPVTVATQEEELTKAQRVGAVLQMIVKSMDGPAPADAS